MYCYGGAVTVVLSALVSHVLACCTVDDPIGPFRTCSPLVASPDTPFLVKAINYTRYHDDLGGGSFDPDPNWNSVAVWLARTTNRVCSDDDGTGCVVDGPVCKLIDCFPMSQDASSATNDGGTIISSFLLTVPGGSGPDGSYYDLASSLFDRHDGSSNFTQSSWRTVPYLGGASSLEYDNNFLGFNMTQMPKQNGTNQDGFYPFELATEDSWPAFDLHNVPCRAYPCARLCVQDAFSGSSVDVKSATACINQCEGVDDIVNYCPDVGGTELVITPQDVGLSSQDALDAYLPDGCARYEGAAFPEAYASYSASVASASSAARASSTSTIAAQSTANSGAISPRREAAKAAAVVVGIVPIVVKVIFVA
ncbi:hypothetical protein BX600DRAFT_447500 [Xylariales sp. PMI_506]|nr:hypothetical protein BX600DRAFT_447500 [Xylariales sp. PMI_506]